MQGLMEVKGTAMVRLGQAALATWTTDSPISCVGYSPDGTHVLSGDWGEMICVRNAQNGKVVVGPFKAHSYYSESIMYSPDGNRIVSGSFDTTIRVWDARDGTPVAGPFTGHTGRVHSVAFSPDSNHIVSGSEDRTIRVWDARSGTLFAGPFHGHTDQVRSVGYSPDGRCVVSGSDDRTIRTWDVNTGSHIHLYQGHTKSVNSVEFSPGGKHIVSGSYDFTIRVWNVCDGTLAIGPFEGHTSSVLSVAYSPSGTLIVSGSWDRTIRVWSAHEGTLAAGPFEGHTSAITSVQFSPDGTQIVSGSYDSSISIWNVSENLLATPPPKGHSSYIISAEFSPDGLLIATGSGGNTIRVWSAVDGSYVAGPFEGHTDSVRSVAFSPDSTCIVSGSSDRTIRVWHTHNGTLLVGPIEGHTHYINSVAFSPDGSRIASGSDDKTICVWDSSHGRCVMGPFEGHTDSVNSVAFSPDGAYIVSGSEDGTICIWNSFNGNRIANPFKGHIHAVDSVRFSHDGSLIVSGSSDKTVCISGVPNGQLIVGPFRGHTESVKSVAFSPDSTLIVSGSNDYTIRLWNADGTLAAPPLLGHTGAVSAVSFSPNSLSILSCSDDRSIRVWDIHQKQRTCMALAGDWEIHNDGWVLNAHSQMLFWLPAELRSYFPRLNNRFTIGPAGSVEAGFNDLLLGEEWGRCTHKACEYELHTWGLYTPKHQPSQYPDLDGGFDRKGESDEMRTIPYLTSQVVRGQTEFLGAYGRTLDTKDPTQKRSHILRTWILVPIRANPRVSGADMAESEGAFFSDKESIAECEDLHARDIPSDQGDHKVVIITLDLQADLEWDCVGEGSMLLTEQLVSYGQHLCFQNTNRECLAKRLVSADPAAICWGVSVILPVLAPRLRIHRRGSLAIAPQPATDKAQWCEGPNTTERLRTQVQLEMITGDLFLSTIMSTPPTSPKPKRSVRRYIRDQYNKLVRSHSPSPSQQSIEGSGLGASPTSPPPRTVAGFLAPPSDSHTAQMGHSNSDSQLSAAPKLESGPIITIWTGLRSAFEELRKVARPFPPLESAIGSLIPCLDLLRTAARNSKEYEDIASELKDLSESLTQHMKEANSTRMSRCIANVAMGIEQQTKLIREKENRGTGRRLLEASTNEEEVMRHYRKIESLFRRLQADANLSTWSIANEVLANTRLEGLAPAKLANYDSNLSIEISRRTCTEGTRTAIMSEMDHWSLDPNAPDLYLMSGMAGTGKTTIACSFATCLEERKQLAASFFCTRTSPECRNANRIVPTIAYQLARYSTPFQSALCEILGEDPDIGTKNIVKQFEQLLKEPLVKVKDAIPENLVVVIDALDECDDRRAVRLVLDLIFKHAPNLPLKFFVTSRPEPEIYSKMIAQIPTSRTILHLHEIEKSLVQADIELYLKEELSTVTMAEAEIVELATRSGNLFIYAATLVRYIQPSDGSVDPQLRLESALAIKSESTNRYAEVDALYGAVVKAALERKGLDSRETSNVRAVLWTVLCAQEPIGVNTLATLSGVDDTARTLSALQPLRSVVHLSEGSGLVSTLHASFPDFMFDKERSGVFFCDPTEHHQLMARRCFEVMKKQLRFNICNLESSFVPDSKVEDLGGRIAKAISPPLSYACLYWADHLEFTSVSNHLSDILREFLSVRLLFWIEVLSLKHEIIQGLGTLVKAKKWLLMISLFPDLVRFMEDAHNFLTGYAASPVSRFTPHIYISSLALCPRSSLVYKKYQPHARGLIGLKGPGLDRLETIALATWAIGPSVRSVSYSSDGSQVAFGCEDGTVGVRNAYDGSPITGPFEGHSNIVLSVAFSPDGTRFVSGSDDRTIKVWNAQDGTLLGEPFQGHTGIIKSVAFSFDGRLIALGSDDQTIRVWSANGGAPVDPFKGHTESVWAVAFSPDGMRIVSGSGDFTVRVWNIQNGAPAFDPLEGHAGTVWSVAFSPDSTRIASGSADRTIRIWNAQDGLLLIGPLEGHTSEVNSVAFSPDGARFVSGSDDCTIRIWSSENH
ncbi:Vegetative incompatibility protein HET-E-1 [Ceratobasidium theobromae]|uniref:Vegetative incompatibility protein HET-E-1 n=1 Tax=Ceratobasidium theobromae TaxID=1582974 RepID=A0A5N5Q8X1_9AGAM|nr:Vegetative incompatibility protein HET-E-1 [Ceratobasidium theobromae]